MSYKQAILVREDLKLPKGKLASQVAHGAVEAVLNSSKERVKEWRNSGQKKVVLKVKDEKQLYEYSQSAKDAGLVCAIITDAGKTTVEPGTVTVAAIGPDREEKIDRIVGSLQLL